MSRGRLRRGAAVVSGAGNLGWVGALWRGHLFRDRILNRAFCLAAALALLVTTGGESMGVPMPGAGLGGSDVVLVQNHGGGGHGGGHGFGGHGGGRGFGGGGFHGGYGGRGYGGRGYYGGRGFGYGRPGFGYGGGYGYNRRRWCFYHPGACYPY